MLLLLSCIVVTHRALCIIQLCFDRFFSTLIRLFNAHVFRSFFSVYCIVSSKSHIFEDISIIYCRFLFWRAFCFILFYIVLICIHIYRRLKVKNRKQNYKKPANEKKQISNSRETRQLHWKSIHTRLYQPTKRDKVLLNQSWLRVYCWISLSYSHCVCNVFVGMCMWIWFIGC